MNWETALRAFVVISMAAGAWTAWKRMPKAVKLDGKRYYPQSDGRFASMWGIIVKDEALIARLKAEQAKSANDAI